jgi:hypothetical protein
MLASVKSLSLAPCVQVELSNWSASAQAVPRLLNGPCIVKQENRPEYEADKWGVHASCDRVVMARSRSFMLSSGRAASILTPA